MPPGPPPSLCRIIGVSPSRIPVEPHGGPYSHQFTPHRPNLLRARLRKGQVMAPDQLELDKFEGVRVVLVFVPLQSGLHGVVVMGAQFVVTGFGRESRGKGCQKLMAGWEVPNSKSRQDSSSGQRQPVRRVPRLELLPRREERGLVDMSVNPITVLKVVLQEGIDDVEGRKDGYQIAIVVMARVGGWVAWCLFGRRSGSRTFLWDIIEISVQDNTSSNLWLTINKWLAALVGPA